MRKILTILCSLLFVAQFSAVSAQEYWCEWKDSVVSVRAVSSVDSVTFSIGSWIYDISCSPTVYATKTSFSAEATVSLGKDVKSVSKSPNIGVCYSDTNDKPTIKDGHMYLGTNLQTYPFTIENLRQDTKYYYRTYVEFLDTVFYGDVCVAHVRYEKDNTFTKDGHTFIDLCLPSGLLWAETNVGASNPWEDGNYYSWGETAPKSPEEYVRKSYYCSELDSDLTSKNDAAYVNWGPYCRMPTRLELQELINPDNCEWTWTTEKGVSGYRVTSKKEHYTYNSIFLPASGYRSDGGLNGGGERGYYWSSTLWFYYLNAKPNTENAYIIEFFSDNHFRDISYRYHGIPVRPVAEP